MTWENTDFDSYERGLKQWAETNPKLSKGMLISVRSRYGNPERYGIVTRMRFCNDFMDYIVEYECKGKRYLTFAEKAKQVQFRALKPVRNG